jgi:hypothetical protein
MSQIKDKLIKIVSKVELLDYQIADELLSTFHISEKLTDLKEIIEAFEDLRYFDEIDNCIVDPRQTYFIVGLPPIGYSLSDIDKRIVTTKEFQGSEISNDYTWISYVPTYKCTHLDDYDVVDEWEHIKREYKPYHFKVVFTEEQKRRMKWKKSR